MWRLLFYAKLGLGLVAGLVLELFRVPDDYHDVFLDDDEEEYWF